MRRCAGLVLILIAVPVAGQPPRWQPPDNARVQWLTISGEVVATHPLVKSVPDPWNGFLWPDCGAPAVDLYERRYMGGEHLLGRGLNCRGFQNENAFLGQRAVSKAVSGTVSGYKPLCVEVTDWNCTHARNCGSYGLTLADGCGSVGGGATEDPGGAVRLPDDLVEYCNRWGWSAPDHPASGVPACRAINGCGRPGSSCDCYQRRTTTSIAGGAWVFFDPTRPQCRPDRDRTSPEPLPEPRPEPGPQPEPRPGPDATCVEQALKDIETAVAKLRACQTAPP